MPANREAWNAGFDEAVRLIRLTASRLDDECFGDRAGTLRGLARTLDVVRDEHAPAGSGEPATTEVTDVMVDDALRATYGSWGIGADLVERGRMAVYQGSVRVAGGFSDADAGPSVERVRMRVALEAAALASSGVETSETGRER